MQSETPLKGDEEEKAPPLEEGGFFRFSGVLSTEKASTVSLAGRAACVAVYLWGGSCIVAGGLLMLSTRGPCLADVSHSFV